MSGTKSTSYLCSIKSPNSEESDCASSLDSSSESVVFLSLGGTPVDGKYEPKKYGVPQIDNVNLDVFDLFTARTVKACLGDLLNS